MAFPSSPVNGQLATVNNIAYQYNSAYNAWYRQSNVGSIGTFSVSSLNVGNSVGLTSTDAYDLDDISNYTDGRTNTFVPTYNGTQVTISSAWNLDVSVNGAKQPAFKYNSDVVWLGHALTANRGYCLDYSGNLRFADAVPARSQILITLKPGTRTL